MSVGQDTVSIQFSFKEEPEHTFDYTGIHHKFLFIYTQSDSILVKHYSLNNRVANFSRKLELIEEFFFSYSTFIELFSSIENIDLDEETAALISTDPDGNVWRCFAPIPDYIARIVYKRNKVIEEVLFFENGNKSLSKVKKYLTKNFGIEQF